MHDLLTSAQADAFLMDHFGVVVCKLTPSEASSEWSCHRIVGRTRASKGASRQEAVTAYWKKYCRPDWTPPTTHDLEWAVRYIEDNNLRVVRNNPYGTSIPSVWSIKDWHDEEDDECFAHAPTLLVAVENWRDGFGDEEDEDEPSSATDILEAIVESIPADIWIPRGTKVALDKARAFIQREKAMGNEDK